MLINGFAVTGHRSHAGSGRRYCQSQATSPGKTKRKQIQKIRGSTHGISQLVEMEKNYPLCVLAPYFSVAYRKAAILKG